MKDEGICHTLVHGGIMVDNEATWSVSIPSVHGNFQCNQGQTLLDCLM